MVQISSITNPTVVGNFHPMEEKSINIGQDLVIHVQ